MVGRWGESLPYRYGDSFESRETVILGKQVSLRFTKVFSQLPLQIWLVYSRCARFWKYFQDLGISVRILQKQTLSKEFQWKWFLGTCRKIFKFSQLVEGRECRKFALSQLLKWVNGAYSFGETLVNHEKHTSEWCHLLR